MEFEIVDEVPSRRASNADPKTLAAVEAAHANPGKWIRLPGTAEDVKQRRGRVESQRKRTKTLTGIAQRGTDVFIRWDPPKPSDLLPHVCETCERGFASRASLARHRQEEDHYQDEAP